jgi:acyl carrier protein
MNEQELRDTVLRALTEVAPDIDPAAIDPEANLAEQLDIDSIDILNLVVIIHERTGIDIPERDYTKLSTLENALAYLLTAQRRDTGADA